MDDALQLIGVSLAVWRLSSMVVREDGPADIFSRIRSLLHAEKQETWVQRGLNCVLCVSFWVSAIAGVWAYTQMQFNLQQAILAWLGTAGAVMLLHKQWK